MSFLHPWLLLGALGAAVPVLLHLFGRRRPRRVQFSSLMLIQQAQRERTALMRARQLLLMVLRALAIVLLSLAAAQPVWRGHGRPGHPVVVLDDTPSMRAMDTQGLFPRANGDPRAALQGAVRLVPGEPRGVLLIDMAYPTGDEAGVGDRGRYRAVDNAPVLAGAGARAGGDDESVVFFTDLQATSWLTPATLLLSRQVVIVDCGRDTPNRSLIGLETREPTAIAGRPTDIVVTGRATTGPSGPVPVRVLVDGREIGTVALNMDVEPAQAICEWRPDRPGLKRVEAVLPEDAMAGDNRFYAVVPVRQRLQVLILGDGPAERLMRLALAPTAQSPVAVRSVAALPEALDADAIVVSKRPTEDETKRLQQAKARGLGLVLLTPQLSSAIVQALTGDAELALGPVRPGPLHISEFDVFRPPLRPFANPQAGDLKQPEFRHVPDLQVRPTHWRVAARFEDGSAAMAARAHTVLVNLPLDPQQTNLPQQTVFVPLMHRLVGFAAGDDAQAGSALVGQALGSSPAPARPGFQRLAAATGAQRESVYAVDLDPAEGDLRRTTPEHVRRCLQGNVIVVRPGPDGAVKLPPLTAAGLHLAGPLLVLVFLLLLAELALSQGLRWPIFSRRGKP
ncbi:BatA domain-containing protein [bacterium]|nr:BatA domain-containing protein [bacterium]